MSTLGVLFSHATLSQLTIMKCDTIPIAAHFSMTPWFHGQGGNVQICEKMNPSSCLHCDPKCEAPGGTVQMAAYDIATTYNAWLPKALPGTKNGTTIQIVQFNNNMCLQAPKPADYDTSNVGVAPCAASDALQGWLWDATTGFLSPSSAAPGMCLTAHKAYGPSACDGAQKSSAWCDTSKDFTTRANTLVSALTAEEKSKLFLNTVEATPRLDLPAYDWWNEALHGVARDGVATSFPQICGVAASLNKTLWTMIGNLTSTEARGKNNGAMEASSPGGNCHGLTFWAPNINIFRDPRWGRGQETPGEDPTINSEYVAHFVPAMQGHIGSAKPAPGQFLKTTACLKHFAVYSQETDREHIGVHVTSQDMADTYLPAFEAGVVEGGAKGLMCSYNAETYGSGIFGAGTQDGAIPSCANKGLINDLVRDTWGFDGYVTSDCGAVSDVESQHRYTPNKTETVAAVLGAGMDTDCGGYMDNTTMMAVAFSGSDIESKHLAMEADVSLSRLFTIQMQLGFFDKRDTLPSFARYGMEVVNTAAHQQLAKEAADQSMVVMKNDFTLPYATSAISSGKKLAVVGRNANATTNMQGNYFGTAPFLITPCQGFNASVGKDSIWCDANNDTTATIAAIKAGQIGAVVIVAGLFSEGTPSADESEGHDRTALTLPVNQDAYITGIAAAAAAMSPPIKVTLVLMSGSALDVTTAKADSNVGAIMWCGYPGQSGGAAIADAVFGVTNPSGRLTTTWYPQAFADKVRLDDYSMRPNATSGNPGRSHRFYTGTPVYPFGTGLSYTEWSTTAPIVRMEEHAIATARREATEGTTRAASVVVGTVEVFLQNVGDRAGANSVMLFAAAPVDATRRAAEGTPLHALVSFEKVMLAPQESTTLRFDVKAHALLWANRTGHRVVAEGEWTFWTGTAADRDTEEAATHVVLV